MFSFVFKILSINMKALLQPDFPQVERLQPVVFGNVLEQLINSFSYENVRPRRCFLRFLNSQKSHLSMAGIQSLTSYSCAKSKKLFVFCGTTHYLNVTLTACRYLVMYQFAVTACCSFNLIAITEMQLITFTIHGVGTSSWIHRYTRHLF